MEQSSYMYYSFVLLTLTSTRVESGFQSGSTEFKDGGGKKQRVFILMKKKDQIDVNKLLPINVLLKENLSFSNNAISICPVELVFVIHEHRMYGTFIRSYI